jgi:hypothetical protein
VNTIEKNGKYMAVIDKKNETKSEVQSYESGILDVLKGVDAGLSMDQISEQLNKQGLRSERFAKEAVWKLVEKGTAAFNDDWHLILCQS